MKSLVPLLMIALLTTSLAQNKSARDYYEEAKKAHALPSLPYVCFRATQETSLSEKEEKWDDPTFAMIGSSRQIADIIMRKAYERMTVAEREKLKALQNSDFLYMDKFNHGIVTGEQTFDNADPKDPSRADWVLEGTIGDKKTPMKWEFNINWGTLRFREKISEGAHYMIFYGQCELVGD